MLDANGTRHWLLSGEADWFAKGAAKDLYWDADRNALTLKPELFLFTAASKDRVPVLADRRGAACDQFGNWYWISEGKDSIRVRSAGSGAVTTLWPVARPKQEREFTFQPVSSLDEPAAVAPRLSGLAVTADHYLVVGTLEPGGLLRFDLHAGGAPIQLMWPREVPFEPFDIAAAPEGGVWVLDRTHSRYWAIGRHFQVLRHNLADQVLSPGAPSDFQPTDAAAPRRTADARVFPAAIDLSSAASIPTEHAVAIESLPDCTVLILETRPGNRFSRIHRFRRGVPYGVPVSTEGMAELIKESSAFELQGLDFAFLPEKDQLFLAGDQGNQSFAFTLSEDANGQLGIKAVRDYYPMRLYGGRGVFTANGQAFYDSGERYLPLISQKRPRYADTATFVTKVFDGHEPDCVWHRVLVDGSIPPGTSVTVSTRASNNGKQILTLPFRKEPAVVKRRDGSEQAFAPRTKCLDTWETLLQNAQGRYLQLEVTLTGDGNTTPGLHALRAYYPRFSYLQNYMPSAYRDDRESASFLERFLANIESFFTATEDRIAAVQMLFDVRSAPVETLEWLAGWFGAVLDPAWDERRRRLFIRHAMDFYAARGTQRGIEWALRLAMDLSATDAMFEETKPPAQSVRLIEQFATRRTPGVVLGDAAVQSGLREVTAGTKWLPAAGGEELSRRYREALGRPQSEKYPIVPPADADVRTAWEKFSTDTLGFVPTGSAGNARWWQDYLTRRYGVIANLRSAYNVAGGSTPTAFDGIAIPQQLPSDGAPLLDWFQFEAVVLPMMRAAHRFTVLLPVPVDDFNGDKHRDLEQLATRVVNLQKPAHTVFDVKFFWQAFRLGWARLGSDTLLEGSARTAMLMRPARLGQSYVAESYLAPNHPWDAMTRQVLGRDLLKKSETSWQENKS